MVASPARRCRRGAGAGGVWCRRVTKQALFCQSALMTDLTSNPCLLLLLPRLLPRQQRSSIGASAALSLAASLSGLPADALAWTRASPHAKPRAEHQGTKIASVSLSYDGCALLAGFAASPHARLGVDVLSVARAALVSATEGDGGEGLLRRIGCGTLTLPTTALVLPCPTAPLSPPLLFALRWTLVEAVLKARGEGLGVVGAAGAVLAGAVEIDGAGTPTVLTSALRGEGAAALAELACAVCRETVMEAAGGGSVGEALSPPLAHPLPVTVLGHFAGPGWRATVCLARGLEAMAGGLLKESVEESYVFTLAEVRDSVF